EKHGFELAKKKGGRGASDHDSFCAKLIPVFFLFSGNHPDYHRPSDTADRINVPGMRKIVELSEDILKHLSTVKEKPEYVAVATKAAPTPKGKAPRLGITPDYTNAKDDGLLVEDVAKDGPADKAGMKAGDRITSIAGQPVTNIQTYTA